MPVLELLARSPAKGFQISAAAVDDCQMIAPAARMMSPCFNIPAKFRKRRFQMIDDTSVY
jgi:hypothetical protein